MLPALWLRHGEATKTFPGAEASRLPPPHLHHSGVTVKFARRKRSLVDDYLCSLSATGAIRSQSHLLLWALPGCPPVHPPERPECRLSAPAPGSSGLASGPLASGTEAKQGLANSPSPDAQRARCWECWGCDGSQPASCQCPRASQPGLCTR